MSRTSRIFQLSLFPGLSLLLLFVLGASAARQGDPAEPPARAKVQATAASKAKRFYVGVASCRKCHDDPKGRNQFNVWYLLPHAKGYATLAMRESTPIAKLSGINIDVLTSPICLGCHSTASDAENWERDKGFHLEDGVQCERCHGPGSEYSDPAIMADREAAVRAGLRIPDKDYCMNCHEEKGSHQSVLKVKPYVFETAIETISHKGRGGAVPETSKRSQPLLDGPKYVGVMVCARCHNKSTTGFAFSKWRLSSHADACVTLGSDKARQIASGAGVEGDPRQAPACLKCHVTGQGEPEGPSLKTFEPMRGVQCESCHGPGSEYAREEVMIDKAASRRAGLNDAPGETCLRCHNGFHGKTLEYESMWKAISHSKPDDAQNRQQAVEYKTPFNLAVTRDGRRLFVACEGSGSLIAVDTKKRAVIAETKVQNLPHGVSLSPDEERVFVSNRGSDTVSVVDARTYKVVAAFSVGDEPHDLMSDASGSTLYVANAGSNDISVVSLREGREVKRLSAGRGTWGMSRSPDNRLIYVTNNLSHFVKFRAPSRSEVTVIDTGTARVRNRIVIPEANLVQGIDFSPDGEFALVTLLRTKNLVPMVRVVQGWVITNGIGILWKDGRVDQLLLDEFDHHFADPTDVAITAKGRYAYVSGGGVNAVAAIDVERMKEVLNRASSEERESVLPNHLGVPNDYIVKRIEVGRGPRGLVASPDGRFVYVADALDDAVSIIDTAKQERVGVIDLGGPKEVTLERMGERIFHSAEATYGCQFSCHSCHPDGGIDGITYDIEPDGIGINPVDNRTLRGILDTAPFKWTGKNPSLSRQCGPRLAVFFTRVDPFTPDQVKALDRYICSIPRNPNRYRSGDRLTPAQRRGKAIFERTHTNTGEEIPVANRCDTCHPGPYFTNRRIVDVGTRSELDTGGKFDVPQLNNIYENAPFLHDGRADTLEEIWTRFNPEDRHGVTNDMTKDQLNDLIEYLKTL